MSKGLETLQQYRDESGRRIYEAGLVLNGIIWHVASESDPDVVYDIENGIDGGQTCTCPDHAKRGDLLICKHRKAIEYYILEESKHL